MNIENKSENYYLDVEGAKIYYEILGKGPVIIFVPGANGDGYIFEPLRNLLSEYFTTVIYDRRGFSRSELTKEQNYENKIEKDIDDIYVLVKKITNEKVIIFGSSSGAIVATKFLIKYSECIKKCIIHEPPMFSILPDFEDWKNFINNVYDIYKNGDTKGAMIKFGEKIVNVKDAKLMIGDERNVNSKNREHWFEYEVRQYSTTIFDIDEISKYKDQLVLACGIDNKNYFPYIPNTIISNKTNLEILDLPDGHLGYIIKPIEFKDKLIEGLKTRNVIY